MSRFKRAFDVVGACAGLIVFAPVMAVAAAAVFIDDGGPVLFRQQRLGYRRRPFSIIKIRTMRDGRITRVGKVLRASGLDEIPQFFNILSGEMSAVGPRPLTEDDVRRLGWTGIAFDFRWETKPGLTGLAQLVGVPPTDAALKLGSHIHSSLGSTARLPADRVVVCGERLRQVARAATAAPFNAGTRRVN
jgi:lipopolysaccharide/colanic/teichoic acid biosynthesis glycosyltransferase